MRRVRPFGVGVTFVGLMCCEQEYLHARDSSYGPELVSTTAGTIAEAVFRIRAYTERWEQVDDFDVTVLTVPMSNYDDADTESSWDRERDPIRLTVILEDGSTDTVEVPIANENYDLHFDVPRCPISSGWCETTFTLQVESLDDSPLATTEFIDVNLRSLLNLCDPLDDDDPWKITIERIDEE